MKPVFASGGYSWLVIRIEDRAAFLSAIEQASVEGDIRPFARFIAETLGRQTPSTSPDLNTKS